MSKSRSWVIGRGVEAPWSFIRIAAASGWPIQIGRNLFVSTALRGTIGWLPTMSKLTPEMTISCTLGPLLLAGESPSIGAADAGPDGSGRDDDVVGVHAPPGG